MKNCIGWICAVLFCIHLHAQTLYNLKLADVMMLQRITPCFGLQVENNQIHAEFLTSYKPHPDQSRYDASTARSDKITRFINARFGITSIQSRGRTKNKSGYVNSRHIVERNGIRYEYYSRSYVTSVFTPVFIFEPGIDYYKYFVTTKGDQNIYGTNGQIIGKSVGSNLRVVSGYVRFCFQKDFGSSNISRWIIEVSKGLDMKLDDVKYGFITTGLKPGPANGFEFRTWGIKAGLELYAGRVVSTKFMLGTAPGIKGRNSFATYISLGIPLVFGRKKMK